MWYFAKIVLHVTVYEPNETDAYIELDHFLFRAPGAEAAYQKACELGESQDEAYLNREGYRTVRRFLGLETLVGLETPTIREVNRLHSDQATMSEQDAQDYVAHKKDLHVFSSG